jgi:SAM-dependent methyltransferase
MDNDVKKLYTEKLDAYLSFSSFFRYPQGLETFFESYEGLRPGLRILDAGCGTGFASFALLKALQHRGFNHQAFHGFDLTPATLARFRARLAKQNIANVQLQEANVLHLESLPAEWTHYDFIVSASMLEYVPRGKLVAALTQLQSRLAQHGIFLLFITPKNWITKLLIEKWWKANGYTREELQKALGAVGFQVMLFRKFPPSHFWLNLSSHVVESRHLT